MTRIAFCLALMLAVAGPAAAQSGRVYGVVADESGAVLPAVQVRASLRDTAGETTRTVVTDGKGAYNLDNVGAGVWAFSMSLPGFDTVTQRVTVQGDSQQWSPTLQLGMIQETVSISTAPTEGPVRRETPIPFSAAITPPPAVAPGVVRVGGSVKPPRKIVDVRPIYPPEAVAQGVNGVVVLRAV